MLEILFVGIMDALNNSVFLVIRLGLYGRNFRRSSFLLYTISLPIAIFKVGFKFLKLFGSDLKLTPRKLRRTRFLRLPKLSGSEVILVLAKSSDTSFVSPPILSGSAVNWVSSKSSSFKFLRLPILSGRWVKDGFPPR